MKVAQLQPRSMLLIRKIVVKNWHNYRMFALAWFDFTIFLKLLTSLLYLVQMRHLYLVLDMSDAMKDQDLRPNRLFCSIEVRQVLSSYSFSILIICSS